MNETILRFGYPATLVSEYGHWIVLLRPSQPTLGSLILAAKGEATAFSQLGPAAFGELEQAVGDIETVLADAVGYAKINYLMLMMVDPHVHFHVLPRYEEEREAFGARFPDVGWPKEPALRDAVPLGAVQIAAIVELLKEKWPKR